jgi:hypothetical protein
MSRAVPVFNLQRDPWDQLILTVADGMRHENVEPMRSFPISDPQHGISLCTADGHELLWIEDLADVPSPIRELLVEELHRREFVPVIERIISVSAEVDPCQWEVETDRGRTRFLLNSEEDVRRLGAFRTLILDSHGIRYLVRDVRQLDTASRRILERYL